jgi:hypothetical protein
MSAPWTQARAAESGSRRKPTADCAVLAAYPWNVIFLGPATRDDVNLYWLRSEWWKLPLPSDSVLIDDPDTNDLTQNEERARILQASRGPILDHIRADARYRRVRIEEEDLPNLFIITSWDWFLDTGRTFALTNTLTDLQEGRGGMINGVREDVNHFQTVKEKVAYIKDQGLDVSDEYLILVATDESGPYTIIDGTHRAAALLAEHQRSPNMPWKGILVDSPSMTANRWHIGFTDAPAILGGLGDMADQGTLW